MKDEKTRNGEERGVSEKSRGSMMREVAGNTLYALAGATVSLAQLPFGAAPFGFALICAVPRRRVAATAAGVCIGSVINAANNERIAILICIAVTLLIRFLFSLLAGKESGDGAAGGIFNEHISLRVVSAAVGGFSLGLYRLVYNGFLYYHLFGAVISIIVAAIACLLWSFLGDVMGESGDGKTYAWIRTAGFMSLCAVAVYGLRGISFYGIGLAVLVCTFVSLGITRKKGILYGSFLALVMGLSVSFTYAPLFVFSTVCYGFISTVSPFLGAAASFAVGMAWGIYTEGISAVSSLAAALLAANVMFLAVDRLYLSPAQAAKQATVSQKGLGHSPSSADTDLSESGEESSRLTVALAQIDDTSRKIKLLCEGFSSLSDMLLGLEGTPPELGGIGEYVRRVGDGLRVEIGELETCGEADIPTELYESLLADEQRTRALALDYRAISDYLAGIMVENCNEYMEDEALSLRLSEELDRSFGKGAIKVTALGDGHVRVLTVSTQKEMFTSNLSELRRTIGIVCGFPLKEGEINEAGGAYFLTFKRVPVLEATYAGRRSSAGEGDFCGDSYGTVSRDDDGGLYAYISDGMGSGREAAVTAELCTAFLGKLLPVNINSGSAVEPTLEMLNGLICGRNGSGMRECAATVDLGAFDLIGSRACFYKSGAAPTYVFREGDLFKLKARTVPVGIVKEPDIGRICLDILPGDTFVMVSDGVTEGREECPELFELLRSRLMTHSAEELADAVMEYARQIGTSDDASVLVVKLKSKSLHDLGV